MRICKGLEREESLPKVELSGMKFISVQRTRPGHDASSKVLEDRMFFSRASCQVDLGRVIYPSWNELWEWVS